MNFENCLIFVVFIVGVVGIFSRTFTLVKDYLMKYMKVAPVISVIGAFEIIWFICGKLLLIEDFMLLFDKY